MRSLIKVKDAEKVLSQLGADMKKLKEGIAARIEEIEGEGRTESWTKDSIASVREEAQTKGAVILGQMAQAKKAIAPYEDFWKDPYAVLSSLPITERGADGLTADNPFAEAMTRMAILTESKLMSTPQLEQRAAREIQAGNLGVAYLLSLEGASRPKSAKIDLSKVVIKEREAGLAYINEANKAATLAEIDFREISGSNRLDLTTARLTAGHMDNGGE